MGMLVILCAVVCAQIAYSRPKAVGYFVEQTRDEVLVYHFDRPITHHAIVYAMKSEDGTPVFETSELQLVQQLMKVGGVKSVGLTKYELTLIRHNEFKWSTIGPQVKEILNRYVGATVQIEPRLNEKACAFVRGRQSAGPVNYLITCPPNPNMTDFHFDVKLLSEGIAHYETFMGNDTDGSVKSEWVERLKNVGCIDTVFVTENTLSIGKPPACQWSVLVPMLRQEVNKLAKNTVTALKVPIVPRVWEPRQPIKVTKAEIPGVGTVHAFDWGFTVTPKPKFTFEIQEH